MRQFASSFLSRPPGRGLVGFGVPALVAGPMRPARPPSWRQKAVGFLRPRQAADGSWSGDRKEPGITALVVTAMLRSGRVTPDDPAVAKGPRLPGAVSWARREACPRRLTPFTRPRSPSWPFKPPTRTAVTTASSKGGRNSSSRPSGTKAEGRSETAISTAARATAAGTAVPTCRTPAFMIEALRDTGLPADDPALQKALVFVSRCQNLKSEFNDQPWAGKVNDGGFIYTAANGGIERRRARPHDGGLRSYAGMTYAGLKSMIYAGLTADDPRVKAAYEYITQALHARGESRPGSAGTLLLLPDVRQDAGPARQADVRRRRGKEHDWRADSWRPWPSARRRTGAGSTARPIHGRGREYS